MEYTTTVINLLGGPGSGKSTTCAEVYAAMKRKGMNVEMVREVAKEWAWQGHHIGPFEQMSILGEQIKRESTLFGKVEYIVTDSPVLLGAFYCQRMSQDFMSNMVDDYYKYSESLGIKFRNYMVPRKDDYNPEGRFQTEKEAINLDFQLHEYLYERDYFFTSFHKPKKDVVVKYILDDLK